ncbi:MAG: hypothetical protein ACYS99_20515, partial [Planctomycetota bacterium]
RSLAANGADVVHFWRAAEHGAERDPVVPALGRSGLLTLRKRKAVLVTPLCEDAPQLPAPEDWFFRMGDTDGI